MKHLIHAIKYFHRKDLIAPLIENTNLELYVDKSCYDMVIPIPMPLFRKYMRGYNHAEAIAYVVGTCSNIPVHKNLLFRGQSRKRQVLTKSRRERLCNQHHAFTASPKVSDKRILLIDDVTTTGATIRGARKELLKHGASYVDALTLAH